MQDTWFQRWCGILSGRRLAEKDRSCLQTNIEYIQQMARKIIGRTVQNDQLLEVKHTNIQCMSSYKIFRNFHFWVDCSFTGHPQELAQFLL